MELKSEAKLLRIFLGEADKVKHTALYEVIVCEARKAGLAGATVWRGIMGFGPTSRIRTARILDLSTDLPIIVEIADEEEKINDIKTGSILIAVGIGVALIGSVGLDKPIIMTAGLLVCLLGIAFLGYGIYDKRQGQHETD